MISETCEDYKYEAITKKASLIDENLNEYLFNIFNNIKIEEVNYTKIQVHYKSDYDNDCYYNFSIFYILNMKKEELYEMVRKWMQVNPIKRDNPYINNIVMHYIIEVFNKYRANRNKNIDTDIINAMNITYIPNKKQYQFTNTIIPELNYIIDVCNLVSWNKQMIERDILNYLHDKMSGNIPASQYWSIKCKLELVVNEIAQKVCNTLYQNCEDIP
jgi:hypothetical protein